MRNEFQDILLALWKERIESKYMFRGMSVKDVADPLDPAHDPFEAIRPRLYGLLTILQRLLDAGFQFTVHEDYSGLSFDLRDIVRWTRRDLDNPGLDFTSRHESACGYARNFQGSQLKQNVRYITDNLPERRSDPLVRESITPADWQLVRRVNAWVVRESAEHRSVVARVRRSCPVFDIGDDPHLLLGSFARFCARIGGRAGSDGSPSAMDAIREVLPAEPREFCFRLTCPLPLAAIELFEQRPTDQRR